MSLRTSKDTRVTVPAERNKVTIIIYITLLRAIITYGAETWALSKTEENKLIILEKQRTRTTLSEAKHIKYNPE